MFRALVVVFTFSTLLAAAVATAQEAAPTPAKPAPTPAKAVATPAKATTAKPAGTKAKASAATPARGATVAKSIIGEIVDPACYLVNGAHGDSHKECATACAKAGQTLAVLEKKTNKLYLLVAERPGDDPNKGVIDYIAQTVLVKGKVYTRGGTSGIMVASVEPYSAKAAGN
jgi:hypothetical protein